MAIKEWLSSHKDIYTLEESKQKTFEKPQPERYEEDEDDDYIEDEDENFEEVKEKKTPRVRRSYEDDDDYSPRSSFNIMPVATGAIGIGIVIMVGYIVFGQVMEALPAETSVNVSGAMGTASSSVFAGFGLIAVGIVVLAAFGLINVFR